MSEWQLEDVTICSNHAVDVAYIDNGDGCPHCSSTFKTIEVPDTPISGLASAVDFTDTSKPKVSKSKKNKFNKNIQAQLFGYIRNLADFKDLFKRSSGVEYRRYKYLFALEQRGIIHNLILQPEYELIPQLKVSANDVQHGFTSSHEIYTPDFCYIFNKYQIIEDVKGGKMVDITKDGKPTGVKRLIPYVKAAARSKHKALLYDISEFPNTVFALTVWHKNEWHYFNANRKEYVFSLE